MEENGKKEAGGGNNLMVPGAIVLAGVVIAAAVFYTSGLNRGGGPAGRPAGAPQKQANVGGLPDPVDEGDPVLGNPEAPVTIVEFSDFQCPFCQSFWSQTLPQIKEQYIKTGKVKLVYRDFPISSIHEHAQKAAEAGECANEQDKFWPYHDLIFQRQSELGAENFKKWAGEVGLDVGQFSSCLDAGKFSKEVDADLNAGLDIGFGGTPSFIISRVPLKIDIDPASVRARVGRGENVIPFSSGFLVVGALSFDRFKAVIDEALAGK